MKTSFFVLEIKPRGALLLSYIPAPFFFILRQGLTELFTGHKFAIFLLQRRWDYRVSLSATDCYIVHEIYNGENAQDQFEYELEQALEAQYKYIVIEPTRIGDETARWITVGNCLHKTTVLAGTACLFTPLALPLDYSHYISLPAGALSLACCTLYGISWQFDPCCKYQVEYDAYKLSRLPLHTLTSSTPVVLVRKDDLHRKRLHNTIALAALVYCVKKIYELYAV
ncbi:transmembrane protein 11, mitochondrial isoform X1 [Marmota flaviventris]|uniref:transmembrane protein 11, mitochondrial isoform X1 n=1 Tax=Marmota flaviventris TaxID=93162 RepID=UPI003A86A808